MANAQNLKPFTSNQSRDEAVRNGKKGGEASGVSRRQKKAFKDALIFLLKEGVKDKEGNPTGRTYQDAVISGLVKRAATGDPRTIELMLRIIGEAPEGSMAQDQTLKKAHELLGGVPDGLE